MFTPLKPPAGLDPAAFSVQIGAQPAPKAQSRLLARWKAWRRSRAVKMTAAVAILAVVAVEELGGALTLQSAHAVVSAPRISLRTPIAGVVAGGALRLGASLAEGAAVVRIANPRLSYRTRDGLRAREAILAAQYAAGEVRRAALAAMHRALTDRADLHAQIMGSRLDADIANADAILAIRISQQVLAQRDFARRRLLAATGVVPPAELERSESAFAIAASAVDAQIAARDSLHAQRAAIAKGVFAEPGANEASYAAQRADEVWLRLAELDQAQASLQSELAEAQMQSGQEAEELGRLGAITIVSPVDALVWRSGAAPGDVVASGDVVAELVDCGRVVVVAPLAQADSGSVEIGGTARILLAGERQPRRGKVLAQLAEPALSGDMRLAALPAAGRSPEVAVLISLDDIPQGECLAGRSAKVRLPRSDGTMLTRLLDWLL